MRLKNVFAGVVAAALMLCAAVPAFAATPAVDEENCFSSTYVMMNVPYGEFYETVGTDGVDALTSATKSKTRAALATGSYHVNSDGSDITGVTVPVKVLTPWALNNCKQVTDADSYDITVKLRGKETTTTYSGIKALFENESYAYYKLSETPSTYLSAWYNPLTGEWNFTKYNTSATTTIDGTSVEMKTGGHHTDYEFSIESEQLAQYESNTIYGVVLTADDGSTYGLHHVAHIWRGTELGFDADDAYFAGLIGHTITKATYYTADGIYEVSLNVYVPALNA